MHACQGVGPSLVDEVIGIVDTMRPSAVLLTPPLGTSIGLCEALHRRQVPFILLGHEALDGRSPVVGFDEHDAARKMTRMLIEAGHKRIGFIRGLPDHADDPRYDGYCDAMRTSGLVTPKVRPATAHFSFHQADAVARRMLEQPADKRPTAIFAASDDMAVGVLRAAHDLGLTVPRDLSVAGFDDTYISEVATPRLATIHAPLFEMAAEAVNLIIAQEHLRLQPELPEHLQRLLPERPVARVTIPYRVIKGSSLAPPTP
jgi:LacI family transcriptional regulator